MATKKSVFLSDLTAHWIEATTIKESHDQGAKWSESINATFDQFRFLLREALPELTMEEWQIILNVYAGCYFPAHGIPAQIASEIMDDMGEISIEQVEKIQPEKAALIRKVHAMPQTAQLAILYFAQIFWSSTCNGDWEDVEKAIKAKF